MGRLSCLVDSVHPRACGEQFRFSPVRTSGTGSSPRLRGTDSLRKVNLFALRFIPAPAGNRGSTSDVGQRLPVHPRACGEQPHHSREMQLAAGSSPRLRGTASLRGIGCDTKRFIPAPAGNSLGNALLAGEGPVHPRACGEQLHIAGRREHRDGSSPRLRGTAIPVANPGDRVRFIPAPAGNRCPATRGPTTPPVHPRACGEQNIDLAVAGFTRGSSPRLRGTGYGQVYVAWVVRFIPAPAGNSPSGIANPSGVTVHPRACGEQ